MAGQRYGRLTVLGLAGRAPSGRLWDCRCTCGRSKVILGTALRSGHTKSCGCLFTEITNRARRHGHRRGGGRTSAEYEIWRAMKARCTNPKATNFAYYGGRGIAVCERWLTSFEDFLADMGPRPTPDHSLNRIDNDGPYAPQNCRWATKQEQANNKRSNRYVIIDGSRLTLAAAARAYAFNFRSFCEAASPGRGSFVYHGLTVAVA